MTTAETFDNNKSLVMVFSPIDTIELKSIFTELTKKGSNIIFVSFDTDISQELKNLNISVKNSDDYIDASVYINLSDEVVSWLQQWSNEKIIDGKNIKELLEYERLSLWWVGRFSLYAKCLNIIRNINRIEPVIDAEKPEKIIVVGDKQSLPTTISGLIGISKNIVVSYYQPAKSIEEKENASKQKKRNYNQFTHVSYFLRILLSKMIWFFHGLKLRLTYKEGKTKILMTSATVYFQNVMDPILRTYNNQDVMIAPIIKELEDYKKYENLVLLRQHPPQPSIFKFINIKEPYIPIEYYANLFILLRRRKEAERFAKLWFKIKNNANFKRILTYRNLPLYEVLEKDFELLFFNVLPGSVQLYEMIKYAIQIEKPDVIITESEYSIHGLAAIVEGRDNNIPSIALQHGIINPTSPAYKFAPHEISRGGEISPNFCPIADKTAVFGPSTKKVLIEEGCYLDSSIVITGATRYDRLTNLNNYLNKEKICKQLNLDPNKNIVLFGMTILWDKQVTMDQFRIFLEAIKQLNHVQFVIKLHPEDSMSPYEKMIHESNMKNVTIIRNVDIHEMIYICDIFLMEFTSVGFETLMLGKPVVSLQILKKARMKFYDESKSIITITKSENIAPIINKLLDNEDYRNEVDERVRKGAFNFTYEKDGRASKRIVELIHKMIDN